MIAIGIDPSINRPAFSILTENSCYVEHLNNQEGTEIEKYLKLKRYTNDFISHVFIAGYLKQNKILIGIEQPQFQTSIKAEKCIESDNYTKLVTAFGIIVACFLYVIDQANLPKERLLLIHPIEWKGQLPKSVTKMRMEKKYGHMLDFSVLVHDDIDAIGIADYVYENHRDKSVPPKEVS